MSDRLQEAFKRRLSTWPRDATKDTIGSGKLLGIAAARGHRATLRSWRLLEEPVAATPRAFDLAGVAVP